MGDSTYLPFDVQIAAICILLLLGGCFAGLTLGLMSLDPVGLRILANVGGPDERRYASVIYPLRKRGNLLLSTLLLGNVLVNNTLSILLDQVAGGLIAIVASTAAIVIFGEILPQAFFSRYGLLLGAKTIWLTRLFMLVLFPVAYPFSVVLDAILGEEFGTVYQRDELRELLRLTNKFSNLESDERNILEGALELKRTTVGEVMLPLNQAYMVEENTLLTEAVLREIHTSGFSRIPVFSKRRGVVVGVLLVRDLLALLLDKKVGCRVATVMRTENIIVSFYNTSLDVLLSEFKSGRAHFSIVRHLPGESGFSAPADASDSANGFEVVSENCVGIVSLNDVLERIIQSKIVGEQYISQLQATQNAPLSPKYEGPGPLMEPADERTPLIVNSSFV
eukprot:m.171200 g.171200  ORF g.171200 m.171200 type:complete len:393 (+) comp17266_c1_seq4:441-1619(+)